MTAVFLISEGTTGTITSLLLVGRRRSVFFDGEASGNRGQLYVEWCSVLFVRDGGLSITDQRR